MRIGAGRWRLEWLGYGSSGCVAGGGNVEIGSKAHENRLLILNYVASKVPIFSGYSWTGVSGIYFGLALFIVGGD